MSPRISDRVINGMQFDCCNCARKIERALEDKGLSQTYLLEKLKENKSTSAAALSMFLRMRTHSIGVETVMEIGHVLGLNPVELAKLYLIDKIAVFKRCRNKEFAETVKKWLKKRGYNANGVKTLSRASNGRWQPDKGDQSPQVQEDQPAGVSTT